MFHDMYFPSFSEGLSLRANPSVVVQVEPVFPFLFGGTFIEAISGDVDSAPIWHISLPFRRDFH